MKAKIYVTLKRGVLDPQGKAIRASLSHLGIDGVEDVRVGKFMEITLKEIGSRKLVAASTRRAAACWRTR